MPWHRRELRRELRRAARDHDGRADAERPLPTQMMMKRLSWCSHLEVFHSAAAAGVGKAESPPLALLHRGGGCGGGGFRSELQELERVASPLPGRHVDASRVVVVLQASILRDRDVEPLRVVPSPPVRLVVEPHDALLAPRVDQRAVAAEAGRRGHPSSTRREGARPAAAAARGRARAPWAAAAAEAGAGRREGGAMGARHRVARRLLREGARALEAIVQMPRAAAVRRTAALRRRPSARLVGVRSRPAECPVASAGRRLDRW